MLRPCLNLPLSLLRETIQMKITKNKNHDFLKTAGKGAIAIALVVWANIIQATPVRQSQQKPNIILILRTIKDGQILQSR